MGITKFWPALKKISENIEDKQDFHQSERINANTIIIDTVDLLTKSSYDFDIGVAWNPSVGYETKTDEMTIEKLSESVYRLIVNLFKTRPNLTSIVFASDNMANVPVIKHGTWWERNKAQNLGSAMKWNYSLSSQTLFFYPSSEKDYKFTLNKVVGHTPMGFSLHIGQSIPIDMILDRYTRVVIFSLIFYNVFNKIKDNAKDFVALVKQGSVFVLNPIFDFSKRDSFYSPGDNSLMGNLLMVQNENLTIQICLEGLHIGEGDIQSMFIIEKMFNENRNNGNQNIILQFVSQDSDVTCILLLARHAMLQKKYDNFVIVQTKIGQKGEAENYVINLVYQNLFKFYRDRATRDEKKEDHAIPFMLTLFLLISGSDFWTEMHLHSDFLEKILTDYNILTDLKINMDQTLSACIDHCYNAVNLMYDNSELWPVDVVVNCESVFKMIVYCFIRNISFSVEISKTEGKNPAKVTKKKIDIVNEVKKKIVTELLQNIIYKNNPFQNINTYNSLIEQTWNNFIISTFYKNTKNSKLDETSKEAAVIYLKNLIQYYKYISTQEQMKNFNNMLLSLLNNSNYYIKRIPHNRATFVDSTQNFVITETRQNTTDLAAKMYCFINDTVDNENRYNPKNPNEIPDYKSSLHKLSLQLKTIFDDLNKKDTDAASNVINKFLNYNYLTTENDDGNNAADQTNKRLDFFPGDICLISMIQRSAAIAWIFSYWSAGHKPSFSAACPIKDSIDIKNHAPSYYSNNLTVEKEEGQCVLSLSLSSNPQMFGLYEIAGLMIVTESKKTPTIITHAFHNPNFIHPALRTDERFSASITNMDIIFYITLKDNKKSADFPILNRQLQNIPLFINSHSIDYLENKAREAKKTSLEMQDENAKFEQQIEKEQTRDFRMFVAIIDKMLDKLLITMLDQVLILNLNDNANAVNNPSAVTWMGRFIDEVFKYYEIEDELKVLPDEQLIFLKIYIPFFINGEKMDLLPVINSSSIIFEQVQKDSIMVPICRSLIDNPLIDPNTEDIFSAESSQNRNDTFFSEKRSVDQYQNVPDLFERFIYLDSTLWKKSNVRTAGFAFPEKDTHLYYQNARMLDKNPYFLQVYRGIYNANGLCDSTGYFSTLTLMSEGEFIIGTKTNLQKNNDSNLPVSMKSDYAMKKVELQLREMAKLPYFASLSFIIPFNGRITTREALTRMNHTISDKQNPDGKLCNPISNLLTSTDVFEFSDDDISKTAAALFQKNPIKALFDRAVRVQEIDKKGKGSYSDDTNTILKDSILSYSIHVCDFCLPLLMIDVSFLVMPSTVNNVVAYNEYSQRTWSATWVTTLIKIRKPMETAFDTFLNYKIEQSRFVKENAFVSIDNNKKISEARHIEQYSGILSSLEENSEYMPNDEDLKILKFIKQTKLPMRSFTKGFKEIKQFYWSTVLFAVMKQTVTELNEANVAVTKQLFSDWSKDGFSGLMDLLSDEENDKYNLQMIFLNKIFPLFSGVYMRVTEKSVEILFVGLQHNLILHYIKYVKQKNAAIVMNETGFSIKFNNPEPYELELKFIEVISFAESEKKGTSGKSKKK